MVIANVQFKKCMIYFFSRANAERAQCSRSGRCLGLVATDIFGPIVTDAVRDEAKNKVYALALLESPPQLAEANGHEKADSSTKMMNG